MKRCAPILIVTLVLAVTVAGCGGERQSGIGDGSIGDGDRIPVSENADTQPASLAHVHGIGRNPGNGDVYLATHQGLWRLRTDLGPERVGDYLHDFMGFSVVGPDHFVASGHPNSARSLPPHLGLIESKDAGKTWVSRSLLGEADFHTLRAVGDTMLGWNSQNGALMTSSNLSSWDTITDGVMMIDVATEPQQQTLVASVPRDQTQLETQRSSDGGKTFAAVDGAPQLARFAWLERARLWGFAPDGIVWTSADEARTWKRAGRLDALPDAVTATKDEILAAVDGTVMRSIDGGYSWQEIHEYET